jgi:hypothetical protein
MVGFGWAPARAGSVATARRREGRRVFMGSSGAAFALLWNDTVFAEWMAAALD